MKNGNKIKSILFKFTAILLLSNIMLGTFPQYVFAKTTSSVPQIKESQSSDKVTSTDMDFISESSTESALPKLDLDLDNLGSSAAFRGKMHIRKLMKKTYRATEKIDIEVENAKSSEINVTVIDPKGNPVDLNEKITSKDLTSTIEIPPPDLSFIPGKYKVVVEDRTGEKSVQEFLWGVLAINTNKSIYAPNEMANISMAVLDETGEMVCDADVKLVIENKTLNKSEEFSIGNGKIKVNPVCKSKKFTLVPDYEAKFQTQGAGEYIMNLTAVTKNGTESIQSKFEVRDEVAFDVERNTATRIFPYEKYPVNLTITANRDFKGTIEEMVPGSFEIEQDSGAQVLGVNTTTDSSSSAKTDFTNIIDYTPEKIPTLETGQIHQLSLPFNGDYGISQTFGGDPDDPELAKKYHTYGVVGHDGIDFRTPKGTQVLAADDGVVSRARENYDYGTTVVIDHSWGRTYYGHLSELKVKEGDSVEKGEVVGLSGNTGLSTGPHLHFGVKPFSNNPENGYYGKVDPLPYLTNSFANSIMGGKSILGVNTARTGNIEYKKVIWEVDVKKGEKINLSYKYKAPLVSPYFYFLGPLKFKENDKTVFQEARRWQIAADAVTIDTTVSTTQAEHNGASPTIVFTTDTDGYAFYVDSNGAAVYRKTTNGGSSWGSTVTVDSQTDVISVAVWYDQWTPGDTSGTKIYIATNDGADVWYRELDTSTDTFGAAVVNASGAGQGGAFAAGSNAVTITKATTGELFMGIVDDADSFVLRCSTTCGTATNWTEAGTSPFTGAAGDYTILLPLASGDILSIYWDDSADDILSQEFEDGAGTWAGSWTTINSAADNNTTYDSAFSATLKKSDNTIYLAYVDDAATIGAANDDIKTASYDGSSWTAGTDIITNDPNRGITNVTLSYDMNKDVIYAAYSVLETTNNAASGSVFYKRSTDGMSTWSSEIGQLNNNADTIYGLRSGLMNENRLYATWYRQTPDDLFGTNLGNIAPSTEYIYAGQAGSQVSTLEQGTSNNYLGGAFTFVRTASSANITSITLTDTGTIDAASYLSNVKLYYETASTCIYDGNETLFGSDSTFDGSEQVTITGTMSVGTSQVCVYPVLDVGTGGIGTIELEITDPSADVAISAGILPGTERVRLQEPTNVRTPGTSNTVTIDDTASTNYAEHIGSSPSIVFTTDKIGYSFYVDSDGRGKYAKTMDGGKNWGSAVTVDNQTDVQGIAVWYDQWTPGNTTGTNIHIATFDTSADDVWYTNLDTADDAVSTTVDVSTDQTPSLAAGTNSVAITESTTGELYVGITDATDSFVKRCSTTCTTDTNWTEAGTSPFTLGNDFLLLVPLASGDIMAVIWDTSANIIQSKEFEDGAGTWDASWLNARTGADENTNYDSAFALTLNKTTNEIYMAFVADASTIADGTDGIRTASYDGSTWTAQTNVLTNDPRGISQIALSMDTTTDDIYVTYSTITDPLNFRTGAVYTKSSTDGMSTWGSETGSITQVAEREIYGLRSNFLSGDRIYATWYEAAADDIFGNTVFNINSASSPTLEQSMRHGAWFNDGVESAFTF